MVSSTLGKSRSTTCWNVNMAAKGLERGGLHGTYDKNIFLIEPEAKYLFRRGAVEVYRTRNTAFSGLVAVQIDSGLTLRKLTKS